MDRTRSAPTQLHADQRVCAPGSGLCQSATQRRHGFPYREADPSSAESHERWRAPRPPRFVARLLSLKFLLLAFPAFAADLRPRRDRHGIRRWHAHYLAGDAIGPHALAGHRWRPLRAFSGLDRGDASQQRTMDREESWRNPSWCRSAGCPGTAERSQAHLGSSVPVPGRWRPCVSVGIRRPEVDVRPDSQSADAPSGRAHLRGLIGVQSHVAQRPSQFLVQAHVVLGRCGNAARTEQALSRDHHLRRDVSRTARARTGFRVRGLASLP
jgi:hypothetical protein